MKLKVYATVAVLALAVLVCIIGAVREYTQTRVYIVEWNGKQVKTNSVSSYHGVVHFIDIETGDRYRVNPSPEVIVREAK